MLTQGSIIETIVTFGTWFISWSQNILWPSEPMVATDKTMWGLQNLNILITEREYLKILPPLHPSAWGNITHSLQSQGEATAPTCDHLIIKCWHHPFFCGYTDACSMFVLSWWHAAPSLTWDHTWCRASCYQASSCQKWTQSPHPGQQNNSGKLSHVTQVNKDVMLTHGFGNILHR